MKLTMHPLTPERWPDLEAVFNAQGLLGRARLLVHVLPRAAARSRAVRRHHARAGEPRELKALVDSGEPPGLIGYRGKEPVGWVSLGPREDYAKLARSPVMKPVDDRPVWSIICFVVPAAYRGQGVARALLAAAIAYAKQRGVQLLEAYPVDKAERSSDDSMWFGSQVDVRRRRLRGSRAPQADAAGRSHPARLAREQHHDD